MKIDLSDNLDISENNILDIASISTLKQLLNINHRLISLKFDDITVPSTHNLNLTTIQQCMDGLNDIKATISTNIIRSTREYIDVFTFIKRCRLLKLHKDRDQFNPAREILSYNLPLSEDDIALIYRLIETDSLGKLHNCASASNQERRKFFLTQQLKWFVPEECESKLAQIMSTIYQMN